MKAILLKILCWSLVMTAQGSIRDDVDYPDTSSPRLPTPQFPHGSQLTPKSNRIVLLAQYTRDELRFVQEGIVAHRVNIDAWGPKWTSSLLKVDAGYRTPWSPQMTYSLFPRGTQEYPEYSVAFIERSLVLFEKLPQGGDATVSSPSHPGYQLRRKGDELLLSTGSRVRFYFGSFDYGSTYLLTKLEFHERPGQYTRLKYDQDLLTEIIYPDGGVTKISYTQGLASKVVQTDGITTLIDRDSGGFVTSIKTLAEPPGKKKKDVIIAHLQYENDHQGRILKFIDRAGVEFEVKRDSQKTDTGNVHTTTIENVPGKTYRFQKHTNDQGEWDIQTGKAQKGTPLENAFYRSERRYKKINRAYRILFNKEKSSDRGTEINYRDDGIRSGHIDNAGNLSTYEVDKRGVVTAVQHEDGTKTDLRSLRPNRAPSPVRKGRTAKIGDHVLKYDEYGRIIEHLKPGGETIKWTYHGRSKRVKSEKSALGERRFRFNARHQLSRIEYGNDDFEAFGYDDAGRISAYRNREGVVSTYKYDNEGRLRMRSEGKKKERFTYDLNDQIELYTITSGKKRRNISLKYDEHGQLTDEDDGKTHFAYSYRADGTRYRVERPGISSVVETTNGRRQITSIRRKGADGTIFIYDENGKLSITVHLPRNFDEPPIFEYHQEQQAQSDVEGAYQSLDR